MARVRAEIQLDSDVLRRVDEEARAQGLSRDQVIEESVRRSFAARELTSLLGRVRQRSALTEEEALTVASEERRAARMERRTQKPSSGA